MVLPIVDSTNEVHISPDRPLPIDPTVTYQRPEQHVGYAALTRIADHIDACARKTDGTP